MKIVPVVFGFQAVRAEKFPIPGKKPDDKPRPYSHQISSIRMTIYIASGDSGLDQPMDTVFYTTNEKGPAVERARRFLLKKCTEGGDARKARAQLMFIGFEAALFKAMLGIECSMIMGKPLPLFWWHGYSNHRDVGKIVLPMGCDFSMESIAAVAEFEMGGWKGPLQSAEQDHKIASEIALRLGLVREGAFDVESWAKSEGPEP